MLRLVRRAGRRPDDPRKRDPLDFVLWQPSDEGEPAWDSLWGPGRPGWHIECTALARRELDTDTLDLHGGGGGPDLPPPRVLGGPVRVPDRSSLWPATGCTPALVWKDGHKMSKSLGNLVFISDLRKEWDPRAIRLMLLAEHYRHDWEWHEASAARRPRRASSAGSRRATATAASTRSAGRSTTTSTRPPPWPPSTRQPRAGLGVSRAARLLGVLD